MSDKYVMQIQQKLKRLGYSLGVDGIAGKETLKVFNEMVADSGLKEVEVPKPAAGDWKEDWDHKLEGVHPNLAKVVRRASELTTTPFKVIEGVRSKERSYELWGKGRTASQLSAKGVPVKYARPSDKKVTWLNNPLSSKHCIQSDGYGHAVDLFPAPYQWDDIKPFKEVATAMYQAANELGIDITWGGNWDNDDRWHERGEHDSPHFQI